MIDEKPTIEVGGQDEPPEYPRYYYEAARRLLSVPDGNLKDVALPIIYLQRHCLELIIKELHLASLYLAAGKRMAAEDTLVTPERPPSKHQLLDIMKGLQDSFKEQHLDLPVDLEAFAQYMDRLEKSSPDRYRYAYESWKKEDKNRGIAPKESFPNVESLPLRAIQGRLESLVRTVDFRDSDSLVMQMYRALTVVHPEIHLPADTD